MKSKLLGLFFLSTMALFNSCCKQDSNCDIAIAGCAETPPINEACAAHFQRWFYSVESKSCYQLSYSGCSEKGFAKKSECEACICHE